MFKTHKDAVAHMRQCSSHILSCAQKSALKGAAEDRRAGRSILRRALLTSAWAARAVLLERGDYLR